MVYSETDEYRIGLLIRRVSRLIHQARQNELKQLGVTPTQVGILHFVLKLDHTCTIKQLRESLHRSNTAVVGIINRMERDGLVKRKIDNNNRKHTRILITAMGKKIYKKAKNLNVLNSVIDSIPKEDLYILESYLNTLKNAAQKLLEEK